MKVSTENNNNFGYEKITIVVDNMPLKDFKIPRYQPILRENCFLASPHTSLFKKYIYILSRYIMIEKVDEFPIDKLTLFHIWCSCNEMLNVECKTSWDYM